jgi:SAM-dependent methyltransferase
MYEIVLTAAFLVLYNILPQTTPYQLTILVIYLGLVTPGLWTYIKGPPFVPSSDKTIQNAIKLAKIKPTDTVVDLGCGNGKFLVAASPFCKQAIGYELSFPTYLMAKFRTRKLKNVTIKYKNFWKEDFSKTDVIFCFLLLRLMPDVESSIIPQLPKGSRLVSNTFSMPNLKPTQKIESTLLYKL